MKPGGYVAVTEITWLKENPPSELFAFWKQNYPPMGTIKSNSSLIAECGYKEVASFVLPERAWWDNYYIPLEKRLQILREKYQDDPKALSCINEVQCEIDLYRKYSEWYGYVFYIMQRL